MWDERVIHTPVAAQCTAEAPAGLQQLMQQWCTRMTP